MPPSESEIATIFAHSSDKSEAIVNQAFHAPCITTVLPASVSFLSPKIVESTYNPPLAVAAHRHLDHPEVRGFPVKLPGVYSHTSLEYSSIIQAIIFGLVFTSGAGTSCVGPIYL